jgi:hypothetical protein
MKLKIGMLLPAVLAGILFVLPAAADEHFVVVVHKDNPVESIERKDLSDIFLKISPRFSSGEEAVPVDLGETSVTREAFSKAVHRRTIKAVRWYWQKRRFAVGGTAPGQATSEPNLLRFIATNERGIGYVSVHTDIEAFPVKVVQITD